MTNSVDPYEMEIHDEFVPEELFSEFLATMPQVCVELIVETNEGILLAKREIDPDIWFWPGSRVYKSEELEAAAHRVADEELGIDVRIDDQYGPYTHFWNSSPADGAPSRHTVNTVYHVTPSTESYEIELDNQHSASRFLTTIEPDLHEYVQLYLHDNDLL
jgi:colanic acid biosynthesis protein WcaH